MIGIFDSGIGGNCIKREIEKLLPEEKIIYLADKNNFPYGTKSLSQIRKIAVKNTNYLINKGAKLIVVACNTATVHAINYLRKNFPNITFIGVEPAVKPAGLISKRGIIILSSPKAAKSKQLLNLMNKYTKGRKVFNIGSLELVKAVENKLGNKEIKMILEKTLPEKILNQSDVLVLGCTHFPLIKNEIKKYVGKKIKIIDSGKAVAKQVKLKLNL
ncbi:MAG: glutamate racemase [Candidatus Shapirobacteria bacterium]|nr:glutamate racemase [Candidatus Shapirobacteria bacterium]